MTDFADLPKDKSTNTDKVSVVKDGCFFYNKVDCKKTAAALFGREKEMVTHGIITVKY